MNGKTLLGIWKKGERESWDFGFGGLEETRLFFGFFFPIVEYYI